MAYYQYISRENAELLKYEVVSQELKIFLTRELERKLNEDKFEENKVVYQNIFINRSRSLLGQSIYVLEGDIDGLFHPSEYAWHNGEFQLIFRRLDTVQFIEFVGELIEEEWFSIEEINDLLDQDSKSFTFIEQGNDLQVEIHDLDYVEREIHEDGHPNIRLLVTRMDQALENGDFPAVFHSSASIFETLAKDIVRIPNVQNQTLGAFFDRYRQDSRLPDEILDYILDIYHARNTLPLAGHGSTQPPNISEEAAIILCELTKAFINIEYSLHQLPSIT